MGEIIILKYNYMKRYIYITLLYLSLSSCLGLFVPSKIKNNFNSCYDRNYNGIDTLINIKGYYMMYRPSMRDNYLNYHYINSTPDTTYWYCIFFNDGMFIYSNNKFFESDWGHFIICGDTVKGKIIESP